MTAGKGVSEVVRYSVGECSGDLECGLYTQFVRAAEPSIPEGQGREVDIGPHEQGQKSEYRKVGEDGWRFTVFDGYHRHIAISRQVFVRGVPYVVQAVKQEPSSPRAYTRYFFTLFGADGKDAVHLLEGQKSDDGHLYVDTTADHAALSAKAVIMRDAIREALQRLVIIDECSLISSGIVDARVPDLDGEYHYPRRACGSLHDHP